MDPLKLIVTLKGKASKAFSSPAGVYILGPNLISGRSHWLQNSGSNAIWCEEENVSKWVIGLQSGRGDIYSYNDVTSPQEATTWEYYDGNNFIPIADILIESGTLMIIA